MLPALSKMKRFLFIVVSTAALVSCGKKEEASSIVETGDNQSTIKMNTDLLDACVTGDLDVVKRQISFGSDLNQRTTDGQNNTPLILASIFGHEEVASALVDAGADVNLQKIDGSTALHTAAIMGYPNMVEMLLKNGADDNIRNLGSATALDGVLILWDDAQDIYAGIESALAPYGLKIDYARIRAARPICAKMLNTDGVPKEMVRRPVGNPPITDIYGAVFHEDITATKKFIEEGVNLNVPEPKDGNTPLHLATLVCNIEIVEALIAAGANVNAKNKKGETPLVAVTLKWGTMSFIYGLLDGADNKKFDLDRIKKDRVKIAEILSAAGAK